MVSVDLPASEEMAALVVSAAPVEMALVATVEIPVITRAPAATERAAMAAMAVTAVTAATLMAATGLVATAATALG